MQHVTKHLSNLQTSMPGSKSLSRSQFFSLVDSVSANAQKALAHERKLSRVRVAEGLFSQSAIPGRYVNASLSDCLDVQHHAYSAGKRYVSEFVGNLKTGAGLLLYGDVGVGKTHLACAVGNAMISCLRPVMYCTAMELPLLVKRAWRRDAERSEFEVYEQFAKPELLIIDELCVQQGTDFERVVLSSVIDLRSRYCLPTLAVSNLNPDQLFDALGERTFDRLVGFGSSIIEMRGESLRQRRWA